MVISPAYNYIICYVINWALYFKNTRYNHILGKLCPMVATMTEEFRMLGSLLHRGLKQTYTQPVTHELHERSCKLVEKTGKWFITCRTGRPREKQCCLDIAAPTAHTGSGKWWLSVSDVASQHSSVEQEGTYKPSCLSEVLLTIDASRREESVSFRVVWYLVDWQRSSGCPTSMCIFISLTGFSRGPGYEFGKRMWGRTWSCKVAEEVNMIEMKCPALCKELLVS